MKRGIYITNIILGSLTLLGFVTIYIGLLGMLLVGAFHLISLIYYFTQWKTFNENIKVQLRTYCYIVGAIALISLVTAIFEFEVLFIPIMAGSLIVGIYFTVIISRVYKLETTNQKPEIIEGVLDSGLE